MIGCTDTLHHVNYGSCEGDRDLFVAKILQFAQGTLNPLSCFLNIIHMFVYCKSFL